MGRARCFLNAWKTGSARTMFASSTSSSTAGCGSAHSGSRLMRIDAHHHLWTLARGDYGWLTPALAPIHRDFSLSDLAPLLAAMARNSLVFDALVLPRHLPRLLRLVDDHPNVQFVLDATCRTPQHRLQAIGIGDRGRCGLANCGSTESGGSCRCVLRDTSPAMGKRLAGGQSGGRL